MTDTSFHMSGSSLRRALARALFSRPARLALFLLVFVGVLYPDPGMLVRHLRHLRHVSRLPDKAPPSLAPVLRDFDRYLDARRVDQANPQQLLKAVQPFVHRTIPYAWDWDVWDVADYLPSLEEVLAAGREDCDGRAVLAAALLRSKGIPAELTSDFRHVWVTTPFGDTLAGSRRATPLGHSPHPRLRWGALLDPSSFAFAVAVFPLGRELVILLAAWLLLRPPGLGRGRSAVVLVCLLAALMLFRTAGAEPETANEACMAGGAGALLVAGLLSVRKGRAIGRGVT